MKKQTSELEEVVDRYRLIATGLGLSEDIVQVIEQDLQGRLARDKNDPDSLYG